MKKIIPIVFILFTICSCLSRPKNFTSSFENEYTGLDTLIKTDGYYVSQRDCDSAFYSMYMFYSNGLFTIATTSEISPELIECFQSGGKSFISQYPLWGTYLLFGDTIKTQVIRPEGGGCVIFRDYLILNDRSILNISDYVESEYSKMAYMANYPSLKTFSCSTKAAFFPLNQKRDSTECPFIGKKWFHQK